MSIGNINNNSAAQLQLYAQEKSAVAQQPAVSAQTQLPNTAVSSLQGDSVQISEQARALLATNSPTQDDGVSLLTNGMGVEPPKGS